MGMNVAYREPKDCPTIIPLIKIFKYIFLPLFFNIHFLIVGMEIEGLWNGIFDCFEGES